MAIQDFDKLRELLGDNKEWPLKYMFKFVVPNQDGKVDEVVAILPKDGKNSFKHTKSLKFVSVTCIASMACVDDIIIISDKVASISGVISI